MKGRNTGYERAKTQAILGQKHRLLKARNTGYEGVEAQAKKGQKNRL